MTQPERRFVGYVVTVLGFDVPMTAFDRRLISYQRTVDTFARYTLLRHVGYPKRAAIDRVLYGNS